MIAGGDGASTAVPPGNRWDLFDVPDLGTWQATDTVSVVVPVRDPTATLARTLRALAHQTYPAELLEVVVVDDGSDEHVEVDFPGFGLTGRVVRQERTLEFGAGRARNRGAAESGGEILLFLDADMLAEPTAVEAHARWHHVSFQAAAMGFARFVDLAGIEDETLDDAIRSGRVGDVAEGSDAGGQEWREKTLRATNDLREDRWDAFRVVTASNLSMSRDLFTEVGGFRELGVRGVEDTEFGYRLHTVGAYLVPDRAARFWHQGRRFFDTPEARAAKDRRDPVISRYVPLPGFRPAGLDPQEIPALRVVLDSSDGGPGWAECVTSLLASRFADFEAVLVPGVQGVPGDERVRCEPGAPDARQCFPTPLVLEVRAPVEFGRNSLGDLARHSLAFPSGGVELAVEPSRLLLVRTRGVRRAARAGDSAPHLAAEEAEPGSRFGLRVVDQGTLRRLERRSRRPLLVTRALDLAHDARRAGPRAFAGRVLRAVRRRARVAGA